MRSDHLSKSKLLAYRQCPRRLWLEVYRPDLAKLPAATRARFAAGHEVGAVARRLYDQRGEGVLIDVNAEGVVRALERTGELLGTAQPMFEAGISGGGAFAFADIMLPGRNGDWRIIEVKSSTSIKDYHHDDIAIQAYAAHGAGIPLESIEVACIDSSWVYGGD